VIFFAYIGFDAVSTAAQESKNPQRDMPLGILGSLAICTLSCILVSALLTGIVPLHIVECIGSCGVWNRRDGRDLGHLSGEGWRNLRPRHGDASHVAGAVSRVFLDARWSLARVVQRGASAVPDAMDLHHFR
jgi:hypothetical protein